MKKKILAILMACLTLTAGTMAFSACDFIDGMPSGGGNNIQVTADEWKTEISKFKSLDGLKSYTIDMLVSYYDDPDCFSEMYYVDCEHGKLYSVLTEPLPPSVLFLTYFEIGNGFEIEENSTTYTVCNVKTLEKELLNYETNRYVLTKINNLDYNDAKQLFKIHSGLKYFESIKYNSEIIHLEDAYEIFTYNEKAKTYSASIEILTDYLRQSKIGSENYNRWILEDEYYALSEVKIAFQQDSLTMTIKYEDEEYKETYNLKFYDFNKTQIVLSDEDAAALAE